MFDRWFRADPDVMFTRTDRIRLTLEECRLTVLVGILTGVTLTSDNLGNAAAGPAGAPPPGGATADAERAAREMAA